MTGLDNPQLRHYSLGEIEIKKKEVRKIIINNIEEARSLKLSLKSRLTWTCGKCGKVHHDEYRNLFRRRYLCKCYELEEKIIEYNERLAKLNFRFLFENTNEYELTESGSLNYQKNSLPFICLSCGKTFKAYLGNVLSGHKKCDCNPDKAYKIDLTAEQYIEKWTRSNRERFSLCDDTYVGRTKQYRIKCNICGEEDFRYGITLQGADIKCKYCELGSEGEKLVARVLDSLNVSYEREYTIYIEGRKRLYDFFCPTVNLFIEFHGGQHYQAIEFFGGQKRLDEQRERDKEKKDYCLKNGYSYLEIPFSDSESEMIDKIVNSVKFNDQS